MPLLLIALFVLFPGPTWLLAGVAGLLLIPITVPLFFLIKWLYGLFS